MGFVLCLVENGIEGSVQNIDVLEIIHPGVYRPSRGGVRVLIPGIGMSLHLTASAEIS
jgi:hypothetical protein